LTRTYHAACFKCTSCLRRLYAGAFLDHDDAPYCDACYERLFAGNRKNYAAPNAKRPKDIIDTSDPLKDFKAKNGGKLDIQQYSEKHQLSHKVLRAHHKAHNHPSKLHKYMVDDKTHIHMMDGQMKHIFAKSQAKMHKMISYQMNVLQQKLIEQADEILNQEILEFAANYGGSSALVGKDKSKAARHKHQDSIDESRETEETLLSNLDTNTQSVDWDLDTSELIKRLAATNKK